MLANQPSPQTKWCPRCERHVTIVDFTRNRARADGFGSRCKPCANRAGRAKHATTVAKRVASELRPGEEWRAIPGFAKYEASTHGRIRNVRNKTLLVACVQNGYQVNSLIDDRGHSRNIKFHRVVAQTFLPNALGHATVNHRDKNRLNNRVENLEWASHAEQIQHQLTVHPPPRPRKGRTLGTADLTDLPGETWAPVAEDPSRFVSTHGRIKYQPRGTRGGAYRIGVGHKSPCGYLQTSIKRNHADTRSKIAVHILVATAFVTRPVGATVVNHKDGDKTNNHAANLEWVTRSENSQHAHDTNLIKRKRAVVQLSKEGHEVARYASLKDAAGATGVPSTGIGRALNDRWRQCGGFHWVDLETFIRTPQVAATTLVKRPAHVLCKVVRQLDRVTGAELARFESVIHAMRHLQRERPTLSLKGKANIASCATGVRQSAYGYAWAYADLATVA